MSRYSQANSSSNETTTEDRITYANKWVDHFAKVKAIMKDNKLTTRGQVVDFLVSDWEAKANDTKDEEVL